MALSKQEREEFLAQPHIAALSVVEGPDRGPLVVPIWYQYTPGGELWIRTEPRSRKAKAIFAAGRFSMMVQRTAPTVRYVAVEGPVTRTGPDLPEQAEEMAHRYLPPDQAARYLAFERAEIGEQIAVYLRPERWISADLGAN